MVDYLNPKHSRQFESFEAALDFVDNAPLCPTCKATRPNASEDAGNYPSEYWDLGAGFAGARELARTGWAAGRAQFVEGMAEALHNAHADMTTPRWERDVCGSRVSVGAFLAGDPRSMYRRVMTESPRPIVSIMVSMSASAGVEGEVIRNRGIAIASWIDAAESAGIRCELALVWPCNDVDIRISLKQAGDSLDVDRLAFALAHPAMFRRIAFAILERDEAVRQAFGPFYGYPDGYDKLPDGVVYFESMAPRDEKYFGTLDKAVAEVNKRCNGAVQTNNGAFDYLKEHIK